MNNSKNELLLLHIYCTWVSFPLEINSQLPFYTYIQVNIWCLTPCFFCYTYF